MTQETARLQHDWLQHDSSHGDSDWAELAEEFPIFTTLDTFDQVQLAHVINVCRASKAEAGRKLFAQSRQETLNNGKTPNDSHRLGQYLKKFGLGFSSL